MQAELPVLVFCIRTTNWACFFAGTYCAPFEIKLIECGLYIVEFQCFDFCSNFQSAIRKRQSESSSKAIQFLKQLAQRSYSSYCRTENNTNFRLKKRGALI